LDEIIVTIVTNISNLDKTANAVKKLIQRFQELKKSWINGCSSREVIRYFLGSILPASVVAKLEFDSVIPPPDTVEEDRLDLIP